MSCNPCPTSWTYGAQSGRKELVRVDEHVDAVLLHPDSTSQGRPSRRRRPPHPIPSSSPQLRGYGSRIPPARESARSGGSRCSRRPPAAGRSYRNGQRPRSCRWLRRSAAPALRPCPKGSSSPPTTGVGTTIGVGVAVGKGVDVGVGVDVGTGVAVGTGVGVVVGTGVAVAGVYKSAQASLLAPTAAWAPAWA